MFSVRIVTTDHYMAPPVRDIDVSYSEFRGTEVKQVPVLRVYGATEAGQKTCMHVHGVFPYLYVPYDGSEPVQKYLRQVATSIDKALNIGMGKANSTTQHVYKIALVSAIPFYGYHEREQPFLKIFLYNPFMVKRVADLLLGGAIMNKILQPHESHIPYNLQAFIDYNLYGMNMVKVAAIKFRQPDDGLPPEAFAGHGQASFDTSVNLNTPPEDMIWDISTISRDSWLPTTVLRQSTCELEVDVVAADILNRIDIGENIGSNPGLAALWDDERQRRREHQDDSHISPPSSPDREGIQWTDAEAELQERLRNIIIDLQPYINDDDEVTPEPSQKESLTPSSQVESHHSLTDDMFSLSSQDTVILDPTEADTSFDAEPIVNETSILRVVSSSQSFHGSAPKKTDVLDTTQDQQLAEMLASLEDHNTSVACSQATAQTLARVATLEEADSILSQTSVTPHVRGTPEGHDEQVNDDQEERDMLELSQSAWPGDGSEVDTSVDREVPQELDFDMEGMDRSWNSSQWVDIQAAIGDEEEDEELLPQCDGPADDKTETQKSTKKRLGMLGPTLPTFKVKTISPGAFSITAKTNEDTLITFTSSTKMHPVRSTKSKPVVTQTKPVATSPESSASAPQSLRFDLRTSEFQQIESSDDADEEKPPPVRPHRKRTARKSFPQSSRNSGKNSPKEASKASDAFVELSTQSPTKLISEPTVSEENKTPVTKSNRLNSGAKKATVPSAVTRRRMGRHDNIFASLASELSQPPITDMEKEPQAPAKETEMDASPKASVASSVKVFMQKSRARLSSASSKSKSEPSPEPASKQKTEKKSSRRRGKNCKQDGDIPSHPTLPEEENRESENDFEPKVKQSLVPLSRSCDGSSGNDTRVETENMVAPSSPEKKVNSELKSISLQSMDVDTEKIDKVSEISEDQVSLRVDPDPESDHDMWDQMGCDDLPDIIDLPPDPMSISDNEQQQDGPLTYEEHSRVIISRPSRKSPKGRKADKKARKIKKSEGPVIQSLVKSEEKVVAIDTDRQKQRHPSHTSGNSKSSNKNSETVIATRCSDEQETDPGPSTTSSPFTDTKSNESCVSLAERKRKLSLKKLKTKQENALEALKQQSTHSVSVSDSRDSREVRTESIFTDISSQKDLDISGNSVSPASVISTEASPQSNEPSVDLFSSIDSTPVKSPVTKPLSPRGRGRGRRGGRSPRTVSKPISPTQQYSDRTSTDNIDIELDPTGFQMCTSPLVKPNESPSVVTAAVEQHPSQSSPVPQTSDNDQDSVWLSLRGIVNYHSSKRVCLFDKETQDSIGQTKDRVYVSKTHSHKYRLNCVGEEKLDLHNMNTYELHHSDEYHPKCDKKYRSYKSDSDMEETLQTEAGGSGTEKLSAQGTDRRETIDILPLTSEPSVVKDCQHHLSASDVTNEKTDVEFSASSEMKEPTEIQEQSKLSISLKVSSSEPSLEHQQHSSKPCMQSSSASKSPSLEPVSESSDTRKTTSKSASETIKSEESSSKSKTRTSQSSRKSSKTPSKSSKSSSSSLKSVSSKSPKSHSSKSHSSKLSLQSYKSLTSRSSATSSTSRSSASSQSSEQKTESVQSKQPKLSSKPGKSFSHDSQKTDLIAASPDLALQSSKLSTVTVGSRVDSVLKSNQSTSRQSPLENQQSETKGDMSVVDFSLLENPIDNPMDGILSTEADPHLQLHTPPLVVDTGKEQSIPHTDPQLHIPQGSQSQSIKDKPEPAKENSQNVEMEDYDRAASSDDDQHTVDYNHEETLTETDLYSDSNAGCGSPSASISDGNCEMVPVKSLEKQDSVSTEDSYVSETTGESRIGKHRRPSLKMKFKKINSESSSEAPDNQSDGSEERRSRKRKKIEQSDQYRFRSKRSAVDYSSDAYAHIYKLENIKASPANDEEGKERKRKVQPKENIQYIIINKFKGYKSMRVLLEKLDVKRDEIVYVSDSKRRKLQKQKSPVSSFSFGTLQQIVSDVPHENKSDPLLEEQIERLGGDDGDADDDDDDGSGGSSDDESSQDSATAEEAKSRKINLGTPGKGPKKRVMSYHKRMSNAFCTKTRRPKRHKTEQTKIWNTLSLLHDATVAQLTSPNATYADESEKDHKTEYVDVMYKLALFSPPPSDHGGDSPPQPLSPACPVEEQESAIQKQDEGPRKTPSAAYQKAITSKATLHHQSSQDDSQGETSLTKSPVHALKSSAKSSAANSPAGSDPDAHFGSRQAMSSEYNSSGMNANNTGSPYAVKETIVHFNPTKALLLSKGFPRDKSPPDLGPPTLHQMSPHSLGSNSGSPPELIYQDKEAQQSSSTSTSLEAYSNFFGSIPASTSTTKKPSLLDLTLAGRKPPCFEKIQCRDDSEMYRSLQNKVDANQDAVKKPNRSLSLKNLRPGSLPSTALDLTSEKPVMSSISQLNALYQRTPTSFLAATVQEKSLPSRQSEVRGKASENKAKPLLPVSTISSGSGKDYPYQPAKKKVLARYGNDLQISRERAQRSALEASLQKQVQQEQKITKIDSASIAKNATPSEREKLQENQIEEAKPEKKTDFDIREVQEDLRISSDSSEDEEDTCIRSQTPPQSPGDHRANTEVQMEGKSSKPVQKHHTSKTEKQNSMKSESKTSQSLQEHSANKEEKQDKGKKSDSSSSEEETDDEESRRLKEMTMSPIRSPSPVPFSKRCDSAIPMVPIATPRHLGTENSAALRNYPSAYPPMLKSAKDWPSQKIVHGLPEKQKYHTSVMSKHTSPKARILQESQRDMRQEQHRISDQAISLEKCNKTPTNTDKNLHEDNKKDPFSKYTKKVMDTRDQGNENDEVYKSKVNYKETGSRSLSSLVSERKDGRNEEFSKQNDREKSMRNEHPPDQIYGGSGLEGPTKESLQEAEGSTDTESEEDGEEEGESKKIVCSPIRSLSPPTSPHDYNPEEIQSKTIPTCTVTAESNKGTSVAEIKGSLAHDLPSEDSRLSTSLYEKGTKNFTSSSQIQSTSNFQKSPPQKLLQLGHSMLSESGEQLADCTQSTLELFSPEPSEKVVDKQTAGNEDTVSNPRGENENLAKGNAKECNIDSERKEKEASREENPSSEEDSEEETDDEDEVAIQKFSPIQSPSPPSSPFQQKEEYTERGQNQKEVSLEADSADLHKKEISTPPVSAEKESITDVSEEETDGEEQKPSDRKFSPIRSPSPLASCTESETAKEQNQTESPLNLSLSPKRMVNEPDINRSQLEGKISDNCMAGSDHKKFESSSKEASSKSMLSSPAGKVKPSMKAAEDTHEEHQHQVPGDGSRPTTKESKSGVPKSESKEKEYSDSSVEESDDDDDEEQSVHMQKFSPIRSPSPCSAVQDQGDQADFTLGEENKNLTDPSTSPKPKFSQGVQSKSDICPSISKEEESSDDSEDESDGDQESSHIEDTSQIRSPSPPPIDSPPSVKEPDETHKPAEIPVSFVGSRLSVSKDVPSVSLTVPHMSNQSLSGSACDVPKTSNVVSSQGQASQSMVFKGKKHLFLSPLPSPQQVQSDLEEGEVRTDDETMQEMQEEMVVKLKEPEIQGKPKEASKREEKEDGELTETSTCRSSPVPSPSTVSSVDDISVKKSETEQVKDSASTTEHQNVIEKVKNSREEKSVLHERRKKTATEENTEDESSDEDSDDEVLENVKYSSPIRSPSPVNTDSDQNATTKAAAEERNESRKDISLQESLSESEESSSEESKPPSPLSIQSPSPIHSPDHESAVDVKSDIKENIQSPSPIQSPEEAMCADRNRQPAVIPLTIDTSVGDPRVRRLVMHPVPSPGIPSRAMEKKSDRHIGEASDEESDTSAVADKMKGSWDFKRKRTLSSGEVATALKDDRNVSLVPPVEPIQGGTGKETARKGGENRQSRDPSFCRDSRKSIPDRPGERSMRDDYSDHSRWSSGGDAPLKANPRDTESDERCMVITPANAPPSRRRVNESRNHSEMGNREAFYSDPSDAQQQRPR